MDRWACVDVPELPLQLLLRREPAWGSGPVAVVADDRPEGVVRHVNTAARRCRVLPGMRYAEALSLCASVAGRTGGGVEGTTDDRAGSGGLQAAVVDDREVADAVVEITETLRRFSPAVEPCR